MNSDLRLVTGRALLWHQHFPESAEIHLMAVDPSYYRRGTTAGR